ncbi:MAG: TIGR00730 family Rossman fold protein [Alphaproteobacteria bacterium]|jgi:uncharacterized protein (TIGR00730 family)|nr:TIGR00730 family Rossman fold protein [Alphaproteobacteria bacterium]MBT5390273.1 TIGR00730 family Rossman fold protein [Alphaproteobacteria bacterium]MBT5654030.1 TIGR00730 family Rossman fold protein [Alphaproteobacteria bacterium]
MQQIRSVCVYCGATKSAAPAFEKSAQQMGTLIAKAGLRLVYGGGRRGLMGILADAAIKEEGKVLGFIPESMIEFEDHHTGITDLQIVNNMHTRKMHMFEEADAFVILPGGFGTLDEFFEILTWRQHNLHHKPMVVVNIDGYWDPLVDLTKSIVGHHFATPGTLSLFQTVNSVEEVIEALNNPPEDALNHSGKWGS